MRTREITLGLCLGLVAIALILAHACSWGGGGKLELRNSAGAPAETLQSYDSLIVSLEGRLEPRTHYAFRVTPAGEESPIVGQARLTTDRRGNLPEAILLFDVGQDAVPPGIYDVRVTGPNLDEMARLEIRSPGGPHTFTCDAAGTVKNSFNCTEVAYAAGGGFPANTDVQVIVLSDRSEYHDGDPLLDPMLPPPLPPDPNLPPPPPLPGIPVITVATTDSLGNLPITQLMDFFIFAEPGDGFDVVVDLEPYGEFNEGRDAVDGHAVVGLTYQSLDVGSDVDSELACDAYGRYKDTFGTNEDVHAWINPPLQYAFPFSMVDKYVCDHRHEWRDGDVLRDVSGGNEMDGVQTGCTNEPIIVVFPGPLPVGNYDVIIDMNQDGAYTQGLDIVDGGSAESLGKIGFTVE